MASLSAIRYCKLVVLSALLFISAFSISGYSYQFHVGGESGWTKPTGNETETYNDWAMMNRFHVGDTIYFKYQNDSVLEVSRHDYQDCIVTDPISGFNDGNTVFLFDRYGYFYFISGQKDHCESGQKLIVRVMVHPEVQSPRAAVAAAPSAQEGNLYGPESGNPDYAGAPLKQNSTSKLVVASYAMSALGAVLAILYLFM